MTYYSTRPEKVSDLLPHDLTANQFLVIQKEYFDRDEELGILLLRLTARLRELAAEGKVILRDGPTMNVDVPLTDEQQQDALEAAQRTWDVYTTAIFSIASGEKVDSWMEPTARAMAKARGIYLPE